MWVCFAFTWLTQREFEQIENDSSPPEQEVKKQFLQMWLVAKDHQYGWASVFVTASRAVISIGWSTLKKKYETWRSEMASPMGNTKNK